MCEPVPYNVQQDTVSAMQNLRLTLGKRRFSGLFGTSDTGIPQYMYWYDFNAPLKKRH